MIVRIMNNHDHLPFSVRYKPMISALKNIISTHINIAISDIQSLYKTKRGSEMETEKGLKLGN